MAGLDSFVLGLRGQFREGDEVDGSRSWTRTDDQAVMGLMCLQLR